MDGWMDEWPYETNWLARDLFVTVFSMWPLIDLFLLNIYNVYCTVKYCDRICALSYIRVVFYRLTLQGQRIAVWVQ